MTPFFSIIMASTLADYKGAATDRERKIIRAIESVIAQSFESWELIVVADGCEKTFDLVKKYYSTEERIKCHLIEGHGGYGSVARNVGHKHASGIFCLYLDNDDVFGTEHLQKLQSGIIANSKGSLTEPARLIDFPDAVFFDDLLSQPDRSLPAKHRKCMPKRGKCGTSNIAFQRELPVSWEDETYLHDWVFIKSLMNFNMVEILPCEYIVCHIPKPINLDA